MTSSSRYRAPGAMCPEARLLRRRLLSELTPEEAVTALRRDPWPFALIGRWAGGGAIMGSDPVHIADRHCDPFRVLTELPVVEDKVDGAVGGGWFGYLGYQLGRRVERLPPPPRRPVPLPDFWLAYYDHVLRYEPEGGNWWFEALWTPQRATALRRRLRLLSTRLAAAAEPARGYSFGSFVPFPGEVRHRAAVQRCIDYVVEGDIFQANICMRLEAGFSGEPLDVFCTGTDQLKPPHAAFVEGPWGAVASFSPELFLRRRGREVRTSPIKGTVSRPSFGAREQCRRLLESHKDRAENVMIVDLMRNDLGRVCKPGSVKVPSLARAEAHPGLWHLVSDVIGELRHDVDDSALLRATFPPGSVTGAPKIRAMEVISELESSTREVYTGSIGYVSPLAGLELSVAIRTLEFGCGRAWFGAGGGIVADSDPRAETMECLTKAVPVLHGIGASVRHRLPDPPPPKPRRTAEGFSPDVQGGVLETVLVIGGTAVELDAHLRRIAASVTALCGRSLPPDVRGQVAAAAQAATPHGFGRLRLVVWPRRGGHLGWDICTEPVERPSFLARGHATSLVTARVRGGLGAHKWRDRGMLAQLAERRGLTSGQELLIVDGDGEVLEGGSGNLFAVIGATLLTPPTDGRVLPGVTRARVLSLARGLGVDTSVERLTLGRLAVADEVFITSAIRGVEPVTACRGVGGWAPGPVTLRLKTALAQVWVASAERRGERRGAAALTREGHTSGTLASTTLGSLPE